MSWTWTAVKFLSTQLVLERTWSAEKKRRLKCNTQLYTTVRTNHTCIPIQIGWSDLRLESVCRIAVVVISANRTKIRLESCTTSPNTGYARTSTVQSRLSGNLHNFKRFGRILAGKTESSNLPTPNQILIFERSNRHSRLIQDRFHGKMLEQCIAIWAHTDTHLAGECENYWNGKMASIATGAALNPAHQMALWLFRQNTVLNCAHTRKCTPEIWEWFKCSHKVRYVGPLWLELFTSRFWKKI